MSLVPGGANPHPEFLALGDELAMVLVQDQPDATRPIVFGSPSHGWGGDPRMAVYYDPRGGRDQGAYVIARLCDDGEYRLIMEMRANDRPLSPAGVNLVVRRLVEIDSRRGFDAHADVVAHNDRVEAEQRRRNDEWVTEEIAPRLAWAFGRDRAAHVGGRFDHHVVPEAPWKKPSESAEAVAGP